MEKRMRRLTLFLLGWLALVALPASAQTGSTTNYDVEVLIFDMQLPEYEGAELWTSSPISTDPSAAAVDSKGPTEDFTAALAAMRADGRYRVLLHKRWAQPAEPRSNRPPVLLANENNEMNGTLRFFLSRFLHVELNLAYQPQRGAIGGQTVGSTELPTFVINEQRRVKSNELYYFDHPKFGVLLRVTPITPKAG